MSKSLIEALGTLPECECFEDEVTGGVTCDGCVIRLHLDRLTAELAEAKGKIQAVIRRSNGVEKQLTAKTDEVERLRGLLADVPEIYRILAHMFQSLNRKAEAVSARHKANVIEQAIAKGDGDE